MSLINSDNNCLVCLKAGHLNIFSTYNICNEQEELYVEVIKNCFNIEITPATGLSIICNECSIKLRKAYSFRHDVLRAVNRLLSAQVATTNEKPYSEIEYLEDIPFEADYDINTILNPETGQISYTLEQLYDNEEINENNEHSYSIDLDIDPEVSKVIFDKSNGDKTIEKDVSETNAVNELNLEPGEIRGIDKTVNNYTINIISDVLVNKKEIVVKNKGMTNARHNNLTKTILNKKEGPIYTEDHHHHHVPFAPQQGHTGDSTPVNIIPELDSKVIDDNSKGSKSNIKKKCVNKNVSNKEKPALNGAGKLDKIVNKKKNCNKGVKKSKKDEVCSLTQLTVAQNTEGWTTDPANGMNEQESKHGPNTYLLDINNDTKDIVDEKSASKTKKGTKRSKKNAEKKEASVKENVPAIVEEVKAKKMQKKEKKAKKPAMPFTLQPEQTVCDLCHVQFETHRGLSTHMNTHFPQFVCPTCGTGVATKSRLRAHQRIHQEGPFACKICDKQFAHANTRNAHSWRVHSGAAPFKCGRCGARYATFLQRLRHRRAAHGDAPDYPCRLCGASFAYAAYRTKHVRTVHLQQRAHGCACGARFARARELAAHRAARHGAGERAHRCPRCGRAFYFRSALRCHMARHQDEHACTQCEQKFSSGAQLAAHAQAHEHADSIAINLDFVASLHLDELADDYALIDPSYLDLNEL